MISINSMLHEGAKIVTGLAPITPSASTPDYVSLKNYNRMTAIICVDNGETVTGTAITLLQANTVAAGGEKALAFTKMWANADTGATDTLVETAVTSNTFTTATTDNKNLLYVIDIDPATLDEGFDCVRVGTGNGANMVACVLYILWDAKYATATPPSAILD
jgi:hypothetical protein